MATAVDTSIYNNVWKPDPMSGVDLQQKVLGIRNTAIQNKLLQQQEQSGGLDLQAKMALSEAIKHNTLPTGEIDTAGLQRDIGQRGSVNMLDTVAKGNTLNAPTQMGVDNQGRPIYQAAQSVSTNFHPSPNALMPQGHTPTIQQPQIPTIPQEDIDANHDHLDHMQETLGTLSQLPDSDLNLTKLIETGVDLGNTHVESKGKKGVSFQEVAGLMSSPDFPREGPNGEPPPPQAIRTFLQNHMGNIAMNKQKLAQHYGPSSKQMQAAQPSLAINEAIAPTNAPNMTQPVQLIGADGNSPDTDGVNQPMRTMNMPLGFEEKQKASRERINTVQNDATVANKTIPVLEEINNLSEAGAKTGQASGKMYSYLASHGLAIPGITEPAQQLQEIGKYMEQAAIAGGLPKNIPELEALHNANTHPEQLPGTIQNLIPFLKSQLQGSVKKQEFYNNYLKGDLSPDKEIAAKSMWDDNFDPRWLEFDKLAAKGNARGEFLHEHPDMLDKIDQYENLNQMGVTKNKLKKK